MHNAAWPEKELPRGWCACGPLRQAPRSAPACQSNHSQRLRVPSHCKAVLCTAAAGRARHQQLHLLHSKYRVHRRLTPSISAADAFGEPIVIVERLLTCMWHPSAYNVPSASKVISCSPCADACTCASTPARLSALLRSMHTAPYSWITSPVEECPVSELLQGPSRQQCSSCKRLRHHLPAAAMPKTTMHVL